MANKAARKQKKQKEEEKRNEEIRYLRQSRSSKPSALPKPGLSSLFDSNMRKFEKYFIKKPGDWKCSIKSRNKFRRKLDLARHLFQKYPVHPWVDRIWDWSFEEQNADKKRYNIDWFEWYVVIAQGRSLYRETDACLYMTKKEVHTFLTKSPKNNFPYTNIWWTKAYSHTKDSSFANTIACSTVSIKPFDDFWLSVMYFFSKNKDVDARDINNYVDFLQEMKRVNENFSMKGRTLQNLALLRDEWHLELSRIRRGKSKWDGLQLPNRTYTNKKNNDPVVYKITQILDSKTLSEEGRRMRHCVFSYIDRCMKGESSIWSLSMDNDLNKMQKLVTIEVKSSNGIYTICQVSGKFNRRPTSKESAVIRRWANDNKIRIGGYAFI